MYTVLVTGVGAIIGYGIVRSLRALPYPVNIVGMDIYADAVGQVWCDQFEQAVPASSAEYPDFINHIVQKHEVDLVIPGIEQDVSRLTAEQPLLCEADTQYVLNTPGLLAVAEDKWHTYCRLMDQGIPAINTYIDGEFSQLSGELGLPFLLKPRRSYASKGIQQILTREDFYYWKNKLGDNFMVQEIVGDDNSEYTVAAFGYGDGTCSQKIIFQRKLSGEGATVNALTVKIPELGDAVDRLVKLFRPVGPTNFQFRLHERKYLLLEINPRISSSTSLRTAFGYNEAGMCIEFYLEGKKPSGEFLKSGRAVRYIEDLVIYDSDHL